MSRQGEYIGSMMDMEIIRRAVGTAYDLISAIPPSDIHHITYFDFFDLLLTD